MQFCQLYVGVFVVGDLVMTYNFKQTTAYLCEQGVVKQKHIYIQTIALTTLQTTLEIMTVSVIFWMMGGIFDLVVFSWKPCQIICYTEHQNIVEISSTQNGDLVNTQHYLTFIILILTIMGHLQPLWADLNNISWICLIVNFVRSKVDHTSSGRSQVCEKRKYSSSVELL